MEERAVVAMSHYSWPGNIREMQNIIERAAVLSNDGVVRLETCLRSSGKSMTNMPEPFQTAEEIHSRQRRKLAWGRLSAI